MKLLPKPGEKKIPSKSALIRKGRILADFDGISCYSVVLPSFLAQSVCAYPVTHALCSCLFIVQFDCYIRSGLTATYQ